MTFHRVLTLAVLLAVAHIAATPRAHADIGCGQPCRGLVLEAKSL